MRFTRIQCVVVISVLFGLTSYSSAQSDSESAAFTGTGTARLERRPERLRVIIPVTEVAEEMSDALDALKDAAATIKQDLIRLQADEDRITISEPDIKTEPDSGYDMLDMMGVGADLAVDDDGAATVQLIITADFVLPAGDRTELLNYVWNIEKEIRQSDYDVGANGNELNMEQAFLQQMGEGAQNPDHTSFLYLAPVTKAERAELLKEAWRKAAASAEELATATGNRLGQTRFVRNNDTEFVFDVTSYEFDDDSRFLSDDELGLMATGTSPGAVELHVSITAGFDAAPF